MAWLRNHIAAMRGNGMHSIPYQLSVGFQYLSAYGGLVQSLVLNDSACANKLLYLCKPFVEDGAFFPNSG